jgi:hypothetical protein
LTPSGSQARQLAAWLNRTGSLTGLQSEIFWNLIFPHVKNPPLAPTARTAPPAPVQHIVYPLGREPIVADLLRMDGII